ncbi:MAG: hypothetical protein LBG22_07270 [Treponema sp.]|jgi:hypothetical protein|nr:hypothetical protein [Treponema sp.]
MKKGTGDFIFELDEKKYSRIVAYLYNPNNYPGIHETDNAIKLVDGVAQIEKNVCFPWQEIEINGKHIFLPWSYIKDEEFETLE